MLIYTLYNINIPIHTKFTLTIEASRINKIKFCPIHWTFIVVKFVHVHIAKQYFKYNDIFYRGFEKYLL